LTSYKSNSYSEEEITFTDGRNQLYGILTKPMSKGPHPAIVLLHGSERKGVEYPFYNDHSRNLVKSNYAVLRYNSPGVGKSSGSTLGENLDDRAHEAISAVEYLQSRNDIMPSHVGLWGHSQGGWVCQKSAAMSSEVAFIIPVSGPGVTVEAQEVYRVEMQSRGAGFTDEDVCKAVLMRRLMVDMILMEPRYQAHNVADSERFGDSLWTDLMELVYGSNVSSENELSRIIEVFETIKDAPWAQFLYLEQILQSFRELPEEQWVHVKAGYNKLLIEDPADSLSKVTVPVFAVFGEMDQYLPVEKSIELYRRYLTEAGNKDFSFKVFLGADHSIKVEGEYAEGYFEALRDWLTEHQR